MSSAHPNSFCCNAMRDASAVCAEHDHPDQCPDTLVVWSAQHGPGLPIRDGGGSFMTFAYCPWCAAKVGRTRAEQEADSLAHADEDVLV